jgi:hypothetical protein
MAGALFTASRARSGLCTGYRARSATLGTCPCGCRRGAATSSERPSLACWSRRARAPDLRERTRLGPVGRPWSTTVREEVRTAEPELDREVSRPRLARRANHMSSADTTQLVIPRVAPVCAHVLALQVPVQPAKNAFSKMRAGPGPAIRPAGIASVAHVRLASYVAAITCWAPAFGGAPLTRECHVRIVRQPGAAPRMA